MQTGLRQSELFSLTWARVDLFRKCIFIKESKEKQPKTLPLNKIALYLLVRKYKVLNIKTDLVFHSKAFTKINQSNLYRAFRKALREAGIEDFTFHCLRHTFATRMVQRGVDIYKVSKLLGPRDLKSTTRYSHHSPESLRDGVEVLENIGEMELKNKSLTTF